MNRMQKISLLTVICVSTGLVLSVVAIGLLALKVGFPRAWAGFAFMGFAGFSGLGTLIFKKDKGTVAFDERDRTIQLQSTRAGFASSYFVFGLLAMGIWWCYGPDGTITVNVLPWIWSAAFITAFFVQALTTLLLYGKGDIDGK